MMGKGLTISGRVNYASKISNLLLSLPTISFLNLLYHHVQFYISSHERLCQDVAEILMTVLRASFKIPQLDNFLRDFAN